MSVGISERRLQDSSDLRGDVKDPREGPRRATGSQNPHKARPERPEVNSSTSVLLPMPA